MLTKHQQQIIANTYEYAKQKLSHDYSGHDIAHITRVVKLPETIYVKIKSFQSHPING